MFSGFQEIVLVGLIIVGVIILPRMLKPQPRPPQTPPYRLAQRLKWTFRLAIVLSILWPAAWAMVLAPWRPQNRIAFVLAGLAPVVVGWCIRWIIAGTKANR